MLAYLYGTLNLANPNRTLPSFFRFVYIFYCKAIRHSLRIVLSQMSVRPNTNNPGLMIASELSITVYDLF